MEKFFCFGLAVGMMAGALLAVNSNKVRKFVCESQEQVKTGVEKLSENKENRQSESEKE